ncbi:hypothetical protein EOD39_1422 [Acipenser ruthenus]|uniref:Uncharacterized protein n=1 Tax=Acipenser ruthenus TaxID=7906 RepID=A0A444UCD6_ACIRT|nr:hypothetical protein EOD39_1422 [Acipenser ruthenus]
MQQQPQQNGKWFSTYLICFLIGGTHILYRTAGLLLPNYRTLKAKVLPGPDQKRTLKHDDTNYTQLITNLKANAALLRVPNQERHKWDWQYFYWGPKNMF